MKLFKIILVLFAIYFIRRFMQLYRAMEERGRRLHEEEKLQAKATRVEDGKVVEAEYKVVDR